MATISGSSTAVTNGTSAVTAVAAPAIGVKRVIKAVRVNNRDTATASVIVRIKRGIQISVAGSDTSLAVGATLTVNDITLPDQDSIVQVVLGGSVTTNELDITASFEDITQ